MLRAAYPDERFEFRKIWGAYMAAYGFNNVVPARGGDVIKLFLVKTSIPNSSYPAVGSSIVVLHEKVTPLAWVGVVAVVGGLILVVLSQTSQ